MILKKAVCPRKPKVGALGDTKSTKRFNKTQSPRDIFAVYAAYCFISCLSWTDNWNGRFHKLS
jgi:hypothetical protein